MNSTPVQAISKQLGSKTKTAAEIMTILEQSKEVTAAVVTYARHLVTNGTTQTPASIVE